MYQLQENSKLSDKILKLKDNNKDNMYKLESKLHDFDSKLGQYEK